MKLGKYICIEGIDGVGKTTQVGFLQQRLTNSIITSEPGNKICPLTMTMRSLVLDASWDKMMTPTARDYIFQAARSVNLEKIVLPAVKEGKYVISDRGALSGFAYGLATGLDLEHLKTLFQITTEEYRKKTSSDTVYDIIIVLETDSVEESLSKAGEKKEFEAGDAIEMRGASYMKKVRYNMKKLKEEKIFKCPILYLSVSGKTREEVSDEIYAILKRENIILVSDL